MTRASKALLVGAAMAASLATTAQAQTTTVLNFDDLPSLGNFTNPMPAGYGGIDWSSNNWIYIHCDLGFACPNNDPEPYPYTPHSYPVMASVDSTRGLDMTFDFIGGPKVFNGAWVSTFDGDYFGYILKRNGSVVFDSTIATTGSVPTYVSSVYAGLVDEVDIVASDVGDWVVDDLSYTTPAVSEPAPLQLVLPALLAMAGAALRRRVRARVR